MSWTLERDSERVTEWERSDDYATIRKRERGDGGYIVRLDVMEQAEDERQYERESFSSESDADALVEEWQAEYDLEE
ncbi:MAG: hypothetical protein ABEH81_09420 [Halopenitus sp.]